MTWVRAGILIVVLAAVGGSIYAAYLFVTGMQDKIATLENSNGTLKTSVAAQAETVKGLEKANDQNVQNVKIMQNAINNLSTAYGKSQDEMADLRRKYGRPVVRRSNNGKGSAAPIVGGYDDINRLLTDRSAPRNSDPTNGSR